MWESLIELVRATIFGVAHSCGGSLGTAIVLVSAAVRLTLLPLTLRVARRAQADAKILAGLKPELDAIQRRWPKDPVRVFQESQSLQKRHGVRMMSPLGVVSALIQLPLLGALLGAVRNGLGARVRFAFVADLATPSMLLVVLVAALSALGVLGAPTPTGTRAGAGQLLLVASMTAFFLWHASSAVALSYGAGSLVSLLQQRLVARPISEKRGAKRVR